MNVSLYLRCTFSSTIIEDVNLRIREQQNTAILHHYFDFGNKIDSSAESLLRSLMAQLVKQTSRPSKALDHLRQRKFMDTRHGQRIQMQADSVAQPSLHELSTILHDCMEGFDHVYIILDALDECYEREKLLSIIQRLLYSKTGKTHMLVTSRSDVDLEERLHPMITARVLIESGLIEHDIRSYIQGQLHENPKLRRWPPKVQERIESALMAGAQGMYVAIWLQQSRVINLIPGFTGLHVKSKCSPGARRSNSLRMPFEPLQRI